MPALSKNARENGVQKFIKVRELRDRWGGVSKGYILDLVATDPSFPTPIKRQVGAGKNSILLFPLAAIEEYERKQIKRAEIDRKARKQ
jgi:hypothetical protein